MASLKEVKTRIASVESTRKITTARQMISSAHLVRTQSVLESARKYYQALQAVMNILDDPETPCRSGLTTVNEKGAVAVIMVASNSGMCGSFNSRMLKEWSAIEKEYAGQQLLFYPIGKKIREGLIKAGRVTQKDYNHLSNSLSMADSAPLLADLILRYRKGELKEVVLIYYHYKNRVVQQITRTKLLPYLFTNTTPPQSASYIFEPSCTTLHEEIIPQLLQAKLFAALVETQTSEHSARMLAMQLASDNASDLLDELRLTYNKLRQQNITTELLDIIGGSFA